MSDSNPCHGCQKRAVIFDENGKATTCHASCPEHEAWLKKREKAQENRRAEIEAQNNIAQAVYATKKRTRYYKARKK